MQICLHISSCTVNYPQVNKVLGSGDGSCVGDFPDVEVEFRGGDESNFEVGVEVEVVGDDVVQNMSQEELEVKGAAEVEVQGEPKVDVQGKHEVEV